MTKAAAWRARFCAFRWNLAAITSQFTDSRFHPLLRTNLPHTGVDFAAQRGTPVRAVGDGIITEAGWNGGYGKAIDFKHDATYMSRYAHLDRFAEGIQPGRRGNQRPSSSVTSAPPAGRPVPICILSFTKTSSTSIP